MDPLDTILLDAWNRVSERVRRDRVEALKRSRRRFSGVLRRPMRECCLVIRASDTRINERTAVIEGPPFAADQDKHDPIAQHLGHTVTLDGSLIRQLTKPFMIPWPGVTYHQAAKMLGRTYASMDNWVRHGAFQVSFYRGFKYPGDRAPYDPAKRRTLGGQYRWNAIAPGSRRLDTRNRGRPYVWTPAPIDPNNFHGRSPHKVWGILWQWLWEKLPEEYELKVQRVPRLRVQMTRAGPRERFVGWEFICPGRLDRSFGGGVRYRGCGRRCTYLYAPQTVWTIGRALENENPRLLAEGSERASAGFDMPEESGLAGQWFPGLDDPVKWSALGGRSFACKHCWGVRSACMANESGWNEFITHVSGGLLYGRDVPRPGDLCPIKRRKRRYERRTKARCAARAALSA